MASTQLATQETKFEICDEKSQKINYKTFHRKNYFPLFCEFVYNLKITVWKHLMRIVLSKNLLTFKVIYL